MTTPAVPPFDLFEVRDFALECGVTLPLVRLAYRQRGPIGSGEPVLTTTAFSHTPLDIGYLSELGGALDPEAGVWLIQTEQIGNGRSSSPSNTAAPFGGPDFPPVSIRDNVALQARLLDHLGVGRLRLVIGASMGGQQAVQWAVSHPDRVARAVVLIGNARTTLYAQIFLNAVEQALRSDPAFLGGRYTALPRLGLERMAETWAGFALSPRYFSLGLHRAHADIAADTIDGFLAKWRRRYDSKDANDLLLQLDAWRRHDIALTPGCDGDFATAAGRARMPILFMPGSTDVYFHPDDVRDQAAVFPDARIQVVDSLAGHAAALGREPADRAAIDAAVRAFLSENSG
jgi:homoserine O-acetyltransferase